jgi:hypothetical protein
MLIATPLLARAQGLKLSTTALSFNGSSGNVSSQPFTITVTSSRPITIRSVSFSNSAFFAPPASLPITLSPGQTITGQVSAHPESTAQTGTLTIATSLGNATVGLTETATASKAAHSVALKWGPPSTGIPTGSYDVDRALSGSAQFSHIGSTPASTTNWTDTTPQAGQTYQYRVRALDQEGDTGPPSNVITLTIP